MLKDDQTVKVDQTEMLAVMGNVHMMHKALEMAGQVMRVVRVSYVEGEWAADLLRAGELLTEMGTEYAASALQYLSQFGPDLPF
jgi:hypothetical protein